MELKNKILEMWNNEELPILMGLLFDNKLYTFADGNLINERDFSVDEIDDEYVAAAYHFLSENYEGYQVCAGEGSYGSDGYVLVLDSKGEIYWVLFDEINPIERLSIENYVITAINNNGVEFIIPLHEPYNMKMIGSL